MARIDRRRLLQLSGAGAVAAGTGGIAAILASGRAPALAQGTTSTGCGGSDFVPASDAAAQGPRSRGVQEGPRHQAQARDRQRQRPAVAHHLGDPVRHRRRHHHGDRQLAAALRRQRAPTSATWPRKSARRRAAIYDVSQGSRHGRQEVDRRAVDDRRRADRLSQIVARREVGLDKIFPETWEELREAGKKLKAKGRPIGQTAGAHLRRRAGLVVPVSLVVGRQGGRGRRQDRRR